MPDFFNLYNDLTLLETLAFFADAYGVPPDIITERAVQALRTVELLCQKGIYQPDSGLCEVSRIACCQSEAVVQGGGCN